MTEEFSSKYEINADSAIDALKQLNAELRQLQTSGKNTKGSLESFASIIDSMMGKVDGSSDSIKALSDSLKGIAGAFNTQKQSQDALISSTDALVKNVNKGTNAVIAAENRLGYTIRTVAKDREAILAKRLEKEKKAYEQQVALQVKANNLARLRNEDLPYPNVGLTPEEAEAKAIGDASRETQKIRDAAFHAWIKQVNEIEQIEKELNAHRVDAQVKAENEIKDRVKKIRDQRLADEIKDEEDQARLKAELINQEIKRQAEEEKTQRSNRQKAQRDSAKTEESILEKSKNKFNRDVQERIEAYKKFIDLQRSGIKEDSIKNLSTDQLLTLSKGSDLASGKAFGKEDRAALAHIKELQSEYQKATEFQNKLTKDASKLGVPIEAANNKLKEFTLSWQSVGKIVVARFITQAFFSLQNSIRASVKEAEELFKVIAEIQTISSRDSQGPVAYTTALERIVDLSSQLNFTPDDVGVAVYEALSNQIGDSTAELTGFIETAGKLGKVTRSTLGESSDAISSVINAYNLSLSDTEDIASKLFVLVDKGRVKLAEVANNLGNVAVPASQLGVEFDNVVASMSAISIAGVPARESMTLFRNIMFKIISPTEKMKELFEEWGVASGQAAVATFGFEGVLRRLAVVARGGNEEIAELFGTIRAIRGVLGLTGANFEKYEKALEASIKSQENYNEIVTEYLNNPGEKFSALIQQSSNEILQIGKRIVELSVNFAELFGTTKDNVFALSSFVGTIAKTLIGIGAVIVSTSLFATALVSATAFLKFMSASLITYTGVTIGATKATTALNVALAGTVKHPAILAFSALAAVVTAAAYHIIVFQKSTIAAFAEIKSASEQANAKVGKDFDEGLIKAVDTLANSMEGNLSKALKEASKQIKEFNSTIAEASRKGTIAKFSRDLEIMQKALSGTRGEQFVASVTENLSSLQSDYGIVLDRTTEAIEKNKDALFKQGTQMQKNIEKILELRKTSIDAIRENNLARDTSITDRNLSGLSGTDKASAQLSIAKRISAQALNTADIEEAKKLFSLADKFLKESEASAFEAGSAGNLDRHIQFFNQQENALREAQNKRLAIEVAILNQQGLREQKQLSETEELYNQEQALLKARDAAAERIKVEQDLVEWYKRENTEIVNSNLSLDEQHKKIERNVSVLRDFLSSKEGQRLAEGLSESFSADVSAQNAKAATKTILDKSENVDALKSALTEIISRQGTDLKTAASSIETAIRNAISDLERNPPQLQGDFTDHAGSNTFLEFTKFRKTLEGILKRFTEIRDSNISQEKRAEEFTKIQEELVNALSGKDVSDLTANELKAAKAILDAAPASIEFIHDSTQEFVKAREDLEKEIQKLGENAAEANKSLKDSQKEADEEISSKSAPEVPEEEIQKAVDQLSASSIPVIDTFVDNFSNAIVSLTEFVQSKISAAIKDQSDKFIASKIADAFSFEGSPEITQPDVKEEFISQEALDNEAKKREVLSAEQENAVAQEQTIAQQENSFNLFDDFIKKGADALKERYHINEQGRPAMINGEILERRPAVNRINGQDWVDDGIRRNRINGQDWVDDGPAQASASWAVEQGIVAGAESSIPQAMYEGSQSISNAFAEGSGRISQAVHDGVVAAFRENQVINPDPITAQFRQDQQRFATGGPVGTDTIPAWLSPGEYVVKASAARKHFDLLQAVNTGTYRRFSNGGPVSNSQSFTNTFNLKTESPQMQANYLMGVIKRQLSQGKATLSKGRPY